MFQGRTDRRTRECVANESELREHARRRLADVKVPEEILLLEKLPEGVSGKINRTALKEFLLTPVGELLSAGLMPPQLQEKSGEPASEGAA